MKNLKAIRIISYLFIGAFFVFSFSYSTNVDVNSKMKSVNLNSSCPAAVTMYAPGELFYEEGWVGWIDPRLVDEPLPEKPNKEDAKWEGEVVKEGNTTYISCPTAGTKCGRLYTVGMSGVTYVGLYLED